MPFNLFGTPSTQPAATPANQQIGTPDPDPNATADPNATPDPNAGKPDPNAGAKPNDPAAIPNINSLDAMNFLIDNGENGQTGTPAEPINLDQLLTPEALSKVASSIDFSSNITPETMQAIQSGDPKAMLQAIQSVGQEAYKQAVMHSSMLGQKTLQSNLDAQASGINSQIDAAINNKQVQGAIPNSDNPVVANAINAIASQIKQAYPHATPEQVANMTKQSFNQLNSAMNPAPTPDPANAPEEVDWSDFAGFKS